MSSTHEPRSDARAELARRIVTDLGGRFSAEVGIDVDGGGREVERWFLAATLFGTRISAAIAERTYRVLDRAGVSTIAEVSTRTWEELVALLDAGGYARYDFRTATRLQSLCAMVDDRYDGRIERLAATVEDPVGLEAALDALPGWGPVTVRCFLRELRGVWPQAAPPVDDRAAWAMQHLRWTRSASPAFERVQAIAQPAGVDARDLEAALVRLALSHRGRSDCPGGARCRVVADAAQP